MGQRVPPTQRHAVAHRNRLESTHLLELLRPRIEFRAIVRLKMHDACASIAQNKSTAAPFVSAANMAAAAAVGTAHRCGNYLPGLA